MTGKPLQPGFFALDSVCLVDGCDRSVSKRGMCGMHYMRVRRHGDVNASRREHRAKSAREIALADRRALLPRWSETERTCRVCGTTKPIDEFAKGGGGSLRRVCKDCKAEQHRQWRAKNPEHVKEWHRQYGQTAERKSAHRDRERRRYHDQSLKESRYARQLRESHGWTLDEYNAQLEKQGRVCAICKKPCKSGRTLAVDHNHVTGNRRGLLCGNCNRGIGYLSDNPALIQAALDYLLKYEE